MAQPKMSQEPSMEDILASIRRIIDNGEEAGRELERQQRRPSGEGTVEAERPAPATEQPILHDENLSVAPQADDWSRPSPVIVNRGQGTSWRAERESDAIHPASVGEVAAELRAATERQVPEPAGDDTFIQEPVIEEPVLEETPLPVEDDQGLAAEASAGGEALLSLDIEKRVGEALRELSEALKREGGRSVDEIVAEEVRPLLKAWLEENMPTIVERMVASEIERMRGRYDR